MSNSALRLPVRPGIIFNPNSITSLSLPKCDSHVHTSWTDGEASVKEVYAKAVESELEFLLYSEHSRKTSVDWFPNFANDVRSLPSEPCVAYVGTEVKVEDWEGNIDTEDAITDLCDFVMASVHRLLDEKGNAVRFSDFNPLLAIETEYSLSYAALENPSVNILGHMFGMSIRRFGQRPPDELYISLIEKAAAYNVAIEINSYYHTNPLQILSWCQTLGAPVSFGSNAHDLSEVGAIYRLMQKEVANA